MVVSVGVIPPAWAAAMPDPSWYDNVENTFTLTNADQLAGLASLVNGGNNFSGKTIRLGGDIDLSGYQSGTGWTPIGTNTSRFAGAFDGGGFKITDLYINTMDAHQGLFGYASNAVIRNVVVESPNIYSGQVTTASNTGGIAGVFSGNIGMIENCGVIGGVVEGARGHVGGVVGLVSSSGSIANCFSTCDVISGRGPGGVAGAIRNSSIMKNCYSTGNMTGNDSTGGVVGYIDLGSEMQNCYFTGNVTGTTYVGGVVGYANDSEVKSCVSLGVNVTGTSSVGRVVGVVYSATLSDNYANAAMTAGGTAFPGENTTTGRDGEIISSWPEIWWNNPTTGVWRAVFSAAPTVSAPWIWDGGPTPILYWQKLPVVNAATLPIAPLGAAYSTNVTATNNPTGFSLSSAPAWLSINNSGMLSGTPTASGTFSFTVTASNSIGASLGGMTFSITVEPTFTVTFDSQGGDAVPSIDPLQNTAITAPTPPTRPGYSFVGWYKETACINPWDFSTDTVTADITLYAKWTAGPVHAVTFDSQGGSAVAAVNAIPGTTITAPAAPARTGYTFAGWYKEAACVNAWDFAADTVTANITLYAKWSESAPAIPGAVDSIEITGFPLTLAPGEGFTATLSYRASGGGAPDPAPVLTASLDSASAALVQVEILSANSARVTALPQIPQISRSAPANSAVYGEALINFTATQTAGGVPVQKIAAVPLVVADGFATPLDLPPAVVDEFNDANMELVPSDETILPGNVQPPITLLGEDWHLIDGLDNALIEIENPDAYVLPECFEPSGRDAAKIDIDVSHLVPPGKKGLLPLTFRVKVRSNDLFALYGEDRGRAMLAYPTDHLDELFTKIVIQKEIMEGSRAGWYTRLVNGVLKPAEAVEKGILEVTGGESLTLTLSYYVLDDGILEAFERDGYLIVPDGANDNEILDPIWVNMWKPGYAPGDNSMTGNAAKGGGGCTSGAAFLALAVFAIAAPWITLHFTAKRL
jgi:uncharacterized repeat protein (TIGR02543 family)